MRGPLVVGGDGTVEPSPFFQAALQNEPTLAAPVPSFSCHPCGRAITIGPLEIPRSRRMSQRTQQFEVPVRQSQVVDHGVKIAHRNRPPVQSPTRGANVTAQEPRAVTGTGIGLELPDEFGISLTRQSLFLEARCLYSLTLLFLILCAPLPDTERHLLAAAKTFQRQRRKAIDVTRC